VGGGYFWVWILSFIYLSPNSFFIHLFLFFFYFFLHFFSLLIFSLKRRMRWFNLVTFWVLLLSKMYVWYYDGYNRIVVIYCDFTEVIKWNFISIVTLNITEIILCTGEMRCLSIRRQKSVIVLWVMVYVVMDFDKA
jgi:hypothetical protein